MTDKKLFCFGYGYTGDYLGQALKKAGGWTIAGTTRDPEKRRFLKNLGVRGYMFDYTQPLEDPQLFLKGTTHLLISTPPAGNGDPTFLMHEDDILSIPTLEWVGYLSSTSVYGDRDGEWVDENSEVRPSTKRGSRRARAEAQWLSLAGQGVPVHVFRLAGIYGPGRSALDSVRAGIARRIDKPGHAFSRARSTTGSAEVRDSVIGRLPSRSGGRRTSRARPRRGRAGARSRTAGRPRVRRP